MSCRILLPCLLAAGLFLCGSCDKEADITRKDDCVDDYLARNGMVRYQGEVVGCKFFLSLYEYENKQYFLLGNHCADMIAYPTDCNGNKLCAGGGDAKCKDFYDNARYIGVIGIKE